MLLDLTGPAREVPPRYGFDSVPLHRRYRFWLPFLALFSLALALSAYSNTADLFLEDFVKARPGNFIVAQMYLAISPLLTTSRAGLIGIIGLDFGFWFLVGTALDRLQRSNAHRPTSRRGWIWALGVLALAQLFGLALIDGPRFAEQYPSVFVLGDAQPDRSTYLATLSAPQRLNVLFIGYIVPLLAAAQWILVLWRILLPIRVPRAPDRRVPLVRRLRGVRWKNVGRALSVLTGVLGIVLTVWLIEVNTDNHEIIDSTLVVLLPWFLLVVIRLGYSRSWPNVGAYAYAIALISSTAILVSILTLTQQFLGGFIVLLPALSLLTTKRVAGNQWGRLRRHAFTVVVLLTVWAAFEAVVHFLHAAADRASLRAVATGVDPIVADRSSYHVVAEYLREPSGQAIEWLLLLLSFGSCYRQSVLPPIRLQMPTATALRRWVAGLRPIHYAGAAIVVWVALVTARQNPELARDAATYGLMVAAVGFLVPRRSRYRWVLWGALLSGVALYAAGSYDPERDVLFSVAGFAVCYGFWSAFDRGGLRLSQLTSTALVFIAVWGACSLGDALPTGLAFPTFQRRFGRLPSHAQSRFLTLRSAYPGKHVGLALSGGGYRAAVVEAGAIDALEALKIPITHISAVSGGSIIGAYYALGGDPLFFTNAVGFGQFNTTRDFFDVQNLARILLSLPIPRTGVRLLPDYRFSRTDVQANALDRVLFHGSRFGSIGDGAPKLMLGTTDLNSGSALGLTSTWVMTRFLSAQPNEALFSNVRALNGSEPRIGRPSSFDEDKNDLSQTKLSHVVAASGAFPIAFEPISLTVSGHQFLMTDGGITDNSGVSLLLEADRRAGLPPAQDGKARGDATWALDVAIAVDGGAMFKHVFADPDVTAIEAGRRASDIIGSRVGPTKPAEARQPAGKPEPPAILLSPLLYMDSSRDYDYGTIGFLIGAIAEWKGQKEGIFPDDLLRAGVFSEEQQQLFRLVASEVVNLDWESLQTFLNGLVNVDPGYYGGPLDQLRANWLTDHEWQLLSAHVSGARVDLETLSHIDDKRRRRTEALKLIATRVAGDLSYLLQTFVSTPTLEDRLAWRTPKLFRLGEYLVFLNAAALHSALTGAIPESARVTTSAERKSVVCEIEALTRFSRTPPWELLGASKETEDAEIRRVNDARTRAQEMFRSCVVTEAKNDPMLKSDLQDDFLPVLSTAGAIGTENARC